MRFQEGPARNRAIGMYGATAGLATVIGQLLGGVAAELDVLGLGWRGVFVLLALAPYALGFLAASLAGPRLIGRFGSGRVIVSGAFVLTVAFAALAAQTDLGYAGLAGLALVPTLTIVGIAQGFVMPPLFGFVLAGAPARRCSRCWPGSPRIRPPCADNA